MENFKNRNLSRRTKWGLFTNFTALLLILSFGSAKRTFSKRRHSQTTKALIPIGSKLKNFINQLHFPTANGIDRLISIIKPSRFHQNETASNLQRIEAVSSTRNVRHVVIHDASIDRFASSLCSFSALLVGLQSLVTLLTSNEYRILGQVGKAQ